MCGGENNIEHLYILPSQWIALLKYEDFSDGIYDNFQNASCTPIKFFVEENFDSWHHLQSFYLAALIQKYRGKYPFAEIRNISTRKRTRSSHKESDNNVTSSSSSDNETTPKFKKSFEKNINAKFNAHMTTRC